MQLVQVVAAAEQVLLLRKHISSCESARRRVLCTTDKTALTVIKSIVEKYSEGFAQTGEMAKGLRRSDMGGV